MSAAQPERGLFSWTLKREGIIAPDERLPWGQSIALGVQHIFAMFGATVLAPLLMGFDPNTAIFFSGVATLLFFFIVRGRIPSYLGSSFSFIAVVIAASAYAGTGANGNIAVALGGIIAAGVVYAIIGLIVMAVGYHWIEVLMPPIVTGTVVMIIGLNLAPVAISDLAGATEAEAQFAVLIGLLTVLAVALVAVYAPGALRRLPVLIGGIVGYILYFIFANGLGWGPAMDFSGVASAPLIGLPNLTAPTFELNAITLIAPVAVILVAENLGHVKAVAAMTGRNLDPYLGRAFFADGLSTIVAGAGGGTGVTTYAENIGVMAVTKIYSSLVFVIAGVVAVLLGFSPVFGALIRTIPAPVIGGLAIVLFGLIAATGARIWVQNGVDLANSRNLVTAAIGLTMGAGNLLVTFPGGFQLGGIGTATFSVIIAYQLLREPRPAETLAKADAEPAVS